MNKQEFKVGDRVVVTRDVLGIRCAGKTGTIIEDSPTTINCESGRTIRLDTPAVSPEGLRDWVWTVNRKIRLIHEKKKYPVVVITSDGKTTTATMREGKKVLKTATATCSEKDTFSFDEGARIAFERLHGRDPFKASKDKPQPTKLVCVDNKIGIAGFVEGKVYEIKWRTNVSFDFVGNAFCGCFFGGEHYAPFYDSKVVFIPLVED